MKFEDIYGQTISGKLNQHEAASILGISDRTFRRWLFSDNKLGR